MAEAEVDIRAYQKKSLRPHNRRTVYAQNKNHLYHRPRQ